MLMKDLRTFSDEQLAFFDGYFSRIVQTDATHAGNYYRKRVEDRQGVLAYYDNAIIRWVVDQWPPDSRPHVVHAGCGMGHLGAMLAVNGCRVVALDFNVFMAEAAQTVRAALLDFIPEIADRFVVRCAGYPEGRGKLPEHGDRLLVFTNVDASWDRDLFERIVTSFGDYHYVILSLRFFGEVRTDPEEWRALADQIGRLAPVAEVKEFGVSKVMPDPDFAPSWVVMRMAEQPARRGLERAGDRIFAAANEVNEMLLALHAERFARLGLDDSGLYAHYKHLLDHRIIVRPSDVPLAELIVDRLPRFERYVVTNAALGEFGFVLAACGLAVTACDGNFKRYQGMEAGHARLREVNPEAAGRCQIVHAVWPDLPTPPPRTLAVATHTVVMPGPDPAQEAALLGKLAAYDGLLIEPRLFLRMRESEAERQEAVELIKSAGFGLVREFREVLYFERAAAVREGSESRPGHGGARPLVSHSPRAMSQSGRTGRAERSVAAVANEVNEMLLALHAERFAGLGLEDSGLYAHYKHLLDQRTIVRPSAVPTAELIVDELPRFDRYVVTNAGLGELGFVLAACGLAVTACERLFKRYRGMEAGHVRLREVNPEAAARCQIAHAAWPDLPTPPPRTLAVAMHTVVMPGPDPAREAVLLGKLAAYDGLLIEPRVFLRMRDSEAERQEAVELIRWTGFVLARQFREVLYFERAAAARREIAPSPAADERELAKAERRTSNQSSTAAIHAGGEEGESGNSLSDATSPANPAAAERAELIATTREWGYFSAGIKARRDLWLGARMLDVGMGGGPHSIPFIEAGVSEYVGVDPLVGTEHVCDCRSLRDPSIPAYHAFPLSAADIMRIYPNIHLYSGLLEDVADRIRHHRVNVAIMSSASEHLVRPHDVIRLIWELLDQRGYLWIYHANFYAWTGHHEPPRSVAVWDRNNLEHNKHIDWRHLEPTHPAFSDPNFNRIRLEDLHDLIEKYFEIIEWKVQPEALSRLTPEIRKRWKQYSLSELLGQGIFITGCRRDQPLDIDLSDREFYHPTPSYRAERDYCDEDIEPYRLMNSVFFSRSGELCSHTDNDCAGERIFERLKPGDVIRVSKFKTDLPLTVAAVVAVPGSGNPLRLRVAEPIPPDIIMGNSESWTIKL